MTKKALCIFLSIMMVLAIVPVSSFAEDDVLSYLTYEIVDDEVTIISCDDSIKGTIRIPDTIKGYPVTKIGDGAFLFCSNLTKIIIPDSVTNIGYSAFDYTAFHKDETNWVNDALYIGNYLIDVKDNKSGNYEIKRGTKVIADWAFDDCGALTSVTIPYSVTTIGDYAFYHCTNLTNVTIGNTVTIIGNGAFSGCESLTSITIPDSVTTIGYDAFVDCNNLKTIAIPASVTEIGSCAFGYYSVFFGYESYYFLDENTKIFGNVGTAAEKYANENNIEFIALCKHDTIVTKNIVATTCNKDGYTGDTYCNDCDMLITKGEIIPATEHKNETVKGYAATCTKSGLTDGTKCSVCDKILIAQTTIKATGHKNETIKGYAATCTKSGLTDGVKCSVCNTILTAQKEIPMLSHTFGKWTVVKIPTANAEGKEERACSACGEKETRTIEKLSYIIGDVNNDGEITAADARLALRISAGLETLETINAIFEVVDYNGDKEITAADARKILRKSAGLE